MMDNGDMPATAVAPYTITKEVQIKGAREGATMKEHVSANGLTKREAFAMAAMQGAISNEDNRHVSYDILASDAVELANALLKALEEQ
jgi:hypothetical protein